MPARTEEMYERPTWPLIECQFSEWPLMWPTRQHASLKSAKLKTRAAPKKSTHTRSLSCKDAMLAAMCIRIDEFIWALHAVEICWNRRTQHRQNEANRPSEIMKFVAKLGVSQNGNNEQMCSCAARCFFCFVLLVLPIYLCVICIGVSARARK